MKKIVVTTVIKMGYHDLEMAVNPHEDVATPIFRWHTYMNYFAKEILQLQE